MNPYYELATPSLLLKEKDMDHGVLEYILIYALEYNKRIIDLVTF